MTKYLIPMNEGYQKKHYPNGFLDGVHKTTKNGGFVLYMLTAILLVLFTPLTIFGIWSAVQGIMSGDRTSVTGGLIAGGIGILFVAAAIIFLLLGKKFLGKTPERLIDEWAEDNKYPKTVIQEYINQVLSPDTYIMHLAGEFEAKSNVGVGFLTRDFLALYGRIMKRSDVIAACLVNTTDTIGVGSKIKPVNVLNIAIFSRNGRCAMSPVKKEAAEELIALLIRQTPNLDTRQGKILTEKEFKEYSQEIAPNLQ